MESAYLNTTEQTRRKLITLGGVALSGSLAGCGALREFVEDRTDTNSDDQDQPTSTPTGQAFSLLSLERDTRESNQSTVLKSDPEYDYDLVRLDSLSTENLQGAVASPAQESEGDRVSITGSREYLEQVKVATVTEWTDGDKADTFTAEIQETTVTFNLYTGDTVALGTAFTGTQEEATELLIDRSTSLESLRKLIRTFDTLYEPIS
jgi:hypothetical protein